MVIVGLFGETSSRVVFDNCDTRIVSRMVFKNGDMDMSHWNILLFRAEKLLFFFSSSFQLATS